MLLRDSRSNSAYIDEALQWLFKGIQFDRELRNGCTWTFLWLAKSALLWAWSAEAKLTERFTCAQRLTRHLQREDAKTETSWQAFAEILCRHTQYLRSVLTAAFRKRMAQALPDLWKMHGFVVLGVDGSDIAVPLTKSNEEAYASKKTARDRRKKKGNKGADKRSAGPQILLTTLFVVRLYLPWNWQIGGRGDSERGQLRLMLSDLPEDCLIVADAGFVGYELAAEMLTQGAQIVMRVGSNVRLLKKLGYVRESNGIVYLWPDKIARKQLPPLVFRLIVIHDSKAPVYLICRQYDTDCSDSARFKSAAWRKPAGTNDSRRRPARSREAANETAKYGESIQTRALSS